MNREIKFRVFRASNKRLIGFERMGKLGWESLYLGFVLEKEYSAGMLNTRFWQFCGGQDVFTRQQFTGVLDKNGNEIYEGDIVTYTSKKNQKESYTDKISFDKQGYWSPLVSLSSEDGNMQKEFYFEVIGNIIENP